VRCQVVGRAGIYVRVSTLDQHAANQLPELHKYIADRSWEAQEFVDHGVSGAKDSRPALNRRLADARRRRFDVIVVWSLDRLGRSLKHLVGLLDDYRRWASASSRCGRGSIGRHRAGDYRRSSSP
jgi:DNA invertase Pin-like site-specific DNA recombinase